MTRIEDLDTPVLVIDRSRMDANIQAMAERMRTAGIALRPHFKTSKMIEVAKRQHDAGAVGFTCATLNEVEALLDAGFDDLFWAHAPATPAKRRRIIDANRRARVIVGLDSTELVELLAAEADTAGVTVPVRVEVDTGLRRTGVTGDQAVAVARAVATLPGVHLDGIYMHEGQLASMRGERDALRDAGRAASTALVTVAETIRDAGIDVPTVSVGSTPGWDSAPFVDGVTEARPGTYVFFDANQWRLGSTSLDRCALHLHTTVISTVRLQEAAIDAGIKALSSDGSNRDNTFGVVVDDAGTPVAELDFTRAYEEHGVLDGPAADTMRVGERLRILPNHACGVVNMWSRVAIVDDTDVVDLWNPVARY
ncbi:alanine racemase [Microbacterium sp. LRZ72]|uniref:alanine racemase n=1 Tax=Microbacterium sp. LRZ72 TaxID=2942481 RepID=UPI0029BC7780|nr:alanine racemase [Microbacterium sp. LRZ72]MDX2376770.1 alanine racemase [Microbacterium sp. LRZ72]